MSAGARDAPRRLPLRAQVTLVAASNTSAALPKAYTAAGKPPQTLACRKISCSVTLECRPLVGHEREELAGNRLFFDRTRVVRGDTEFALASS